MPKASFYFNTLGQVEYGPSFSRDNFLSDGTINIKIVIPKGIDYNNLEKLALNARTEGFGVSKRLKTRFSFPNFLLGDMLYQEVNGATDSGILYRPYATGGTDADAELMVKIYKDNGGVFTINFPYDKEKYFLPAGWVMVERADGVIMYYYEAKGLIQPDFPKGSYIYMPEDKEPKDVIILGLATPRVIKEKVDEAILLYEGGVRIVDILNLAFQRHMGLIAYMVNLDNVFKTNPSHTDGGNKQKKYKRTNIKRTKRTKKTKRTKRTKRMNIKYMKKSKKNHHK